MRDFAVLILRLVTGGLMAGHGAQKLFGWFEGHGLEGTSGWMESMGLKPGRQWALLAGASEFGGGLLTLLGFLNPLGPLGTMGSMFMAATKVHWGKPIWVTSGGAELPVVNIATSLAIGLAGPGKFSVDNALGLKLPRRLILVPGLALAAVVTAVGIVMSNRQQARQAQQSQQPAEQEQPAVRVPDQTHEGEQASETPDRVAGGELQAGQDASHPV